MVESMVEILSDLQGFMLDVWGVRQRHAFQNMQRDRWPKLKQKLKAPAN